MSDWISLLKEIGAFVGEHGLGTLQSIAVGYGLWRFFKWLGNMINCVLAWCGGRFDRFGLRVFRAWTKNENARTAALLELCNAGKRTKQQLDDVHDTVERIEANKPVCRALPPHD